MNADANTHRSVACRDGEFGASTRGTSMAPFGPIRRLLQWVAATVGLLMFWAPSLQAQDLALTAVLQPVSGCALGNAENVSIRIFNYGPMLPTGTTFIMAYWLDGGSTVNQLVTLVSDFPSRTSLVHTAATPVDLSVPGNYVLNVAINLPGDILAANNAITGYALTNAAASVGGTLSGPASGSSGTLTLSGQTGSVVQWEESPDAQRWFKLANNTDTQSYSGLSSTTRYRARVANAPCASVVSNAHVVTP